MRRTTIVTILTAAAAFGGLTSIATVIQPVSAADSDRAESPIRTLLNEIDRLNAEVNRLQDELNASRARPAPAQAPLKASPGNLRLLLAELDDATGRVTTLKASVAAQKLAAGNANRKLAELQQFIADHETYGGDFQQYQGVRDAALEAARIQDLEARRVRRDQDRAERRARQTEARAARNQHRAESKRMSEYRKRGFSPLGLDVFMSDIGFWYQAKDTTRTRIDYEPGLGNYLRVYPGAEADFSSMTLSGSVLNATEETRHIGIAIVFFDDTGTQIGQEIVQINNARPNVPYPFTAENINMAANAPFASSSQYVLYADPVE